MSFELEARLRLEASAGDSAKVVGTVKADVENLGKSAEKTAGQLNQVGEAAGNVGPAAGKVKEAGESAAKGLDAAAEAAGKFKPAADDAGESSEHLAAQLRAVADQAFADAMGKTGTAAKEQAAGLDVAEAAAGRTVGTMGSLVAGLIGTAGLAAATAVVTAVLDAYRSEQEAAERGAQDLIGAGAELAAMLVTMSEEAQSLAADTGDLSDATDLSAGAALDAATAYDIQASAARRAAEAIREKTAAERDQEIKDVEKRLKDRRLAYDSTGGLFGWSSENLLEKEGNARRDFLKFAGIDAPGGMSGGEQYQYYIDKGNANRDQLSPAARKALDRYNRTHGVAEDMRKLNAADEQYLNRLRESFGPRQPDQATTVDEVVIQGTARPKPKGRGGGGGESDAEREARARDRRLAQAREFVQSANAETDALESQALATAQGSDALEKWRVAEAGRQAVARAGLDNTEELTSAEVLAGEEVRQAAEEKEKAAIAAEKSGRTKQATDDLDRQIAAEQAYSLALASGTKALVDHERAEFIRQELERAGPGLTAEQTKAIEDKAAALFSLQAANDQGDDAHDLQEELRLTAMTADERERETRALEIKRQLLRASADLTDEEADAQARLRARREQDQKATARDLSQLKEGLRDTYVESGELGFDEVAEYGERKLKEMVYNSLLKEPLELALETSVKFLTDDLELLFSDFLREFAGFGTGGASNGWLGSLFGLGTAQKGTGATGDGTTGQAGLRGGVAGGNIISSGLSMLTQFGGGAASGIGGMFSNLGPLMATPIGWIGAAVAAVAYHEQIVDSSKQIRHNWTQAFGGNYKFADSTAGSALAPEVAALASVFMNGNSNNGGNISFSEDGFWDVGGAKATKKRKDQLGGVADMIEQLLDGLQGVGVNARGVITKIQAGDRDGAKVYTSSGQIYKSKDTTSEGIAELVVKALMAEAEFEDPQLKSLVDTMIAANRNWEQILDRMGDFVQAHAARKDLDLELLKYTDARAAALRELSEGQAERRKSFEQYNGDGLYTSDQWATIQSQLTALEAEELKAALEELGDAATDAAAALADAAPRLKEWMEAMGFSDAAQLNPDAERQLALSQYTARLALAQSGDAEALSDITNYAERLFQADAEATSSAQARLALYNQVMAQILALSLQTTPIPAPASGATGTTTTTTTADGTVVTTAPANDNGTVVTTPTANGTVATAGGAAGGDVAQAIASMAESVLARLDAIQAASPQNLAALGEGLASAIAEVVAQGVLQTSALEAVGNELRDTAAHARATAARVTL